MESKIREFAMKGLLATHCVLDLRERGLLRAPAMTADERQEQDLSRLLPAESDSMSGPVPQCVHD